MVGVGGSPGAPFPARRDHGPSAWADLRARPSRGSPSPRTVSSASPGAPFPGSPGWRVCPRDGAPGSRTPELEPAGRAGRAPLAGAGLAATGRRTRRRRGGRPGLAAERLPRGRRGPGLLAGGRRPLAAGAGPGPGGRGGGGRLTTVPPGAGGPGRVGGGGPCGPGVFVSRPGLPSKAAALMAAAAFAAVEVVWTSRTAGTMSPSARRFSSSSA